MNSAKLALLVACATVIVSPAAARRALVKVDGRSMPWEPGVNPKRAFGQGDGERPAYVWGLKLIPGSSLLFTATGIVTVQQDAPRQQRKGRRSQSAAEVPQPSSAIDQSFPAIGDAVPTKGRPNSYGPIAQIGSWGPSGQPFRPADGNIGALGKVFPSYHMPRRSYPVRINALLGAFVDADGKVVGDPFAIGERVIVRVPPGALAIALGVNAESFGYNRGAFDVIINTRTPTVTVEDNPAPPPTP